jgi:hypothetical protein
LNPNDTVALVASAPFQLTLTAVTWAPLCVTVAFHAWVTRWPEPKDQVSRQPVSGSPRLVTATLPENPPPHCDGTE